MTRWRTTNDAGTTLAELLVAMVLFGVVGAITTITTVTTMRTSRGTVARSYQLDAAQLSIDAMTKAVRTAGQPPPPTAGGARPAAIIAASPTDLAFYGYSQAGHPPSKVEFVVSGSSLLERVTPPLGTGCVLPISYGATQTRTLATGLSAGQVVFSYATQTAVPTVTGSPLPVSGTPPVLPAASLPQVEIVAISVSVQQSSNPNIAATVASTAIALPNHLVSAQSLPDSAC